MSRAQTGVSESLAGAMDRSAQWTGVTCLSWATEGAANRMARFEGDFEKGEANGSKAALDALAVFLRSWRDLLAVAGS